MTFSSHLSGKKLTFLLMEYVFDYIVIGSGFGGSTSAMRLSEKGYKVLVLEKGKRWKDKDFPKNNWNIPKFLWAEDLNLFGFQKINVFNEVAILSGAGVGGGSLVYANTHMFPPDAFFNNPKWSFFKDWKSTLTPYYDKAKMMLGTTPYDAFGAEDLVLKEVAQDMGREETFGHVDGVGVFIGKPGEEKDPYFKGLGPTRNACIKCAACMTGCRDNAKNTLEKNYLWFAEKFGAIIKPLTKVTKIEFEDDLYKIHTQTTGRWRLNKNKQVFTSKGLVVSAGVLGTTHLLLEQKHIHKTLPKLSDTLGDNIMTNSEMLIGLSDADRKLNNGVAISAVFEPDDDTHIELCKYDNKSGLMWFLMMGATDEGTPFQRAYRSIWNTVKHPLKTLKYIFKPGIAERGLFFLVMQSLENSMGLKLKKIPLLGENRLSMTNHSKQQIKAYIPQGQKVAKLFAKKTKATITNATTETLFNMSSTAHILGGCPMGETEKTGVVNDKFEVHGYPNMYILDGSIMPCNLGVNPSLTITTLTEYAMDFVPEKPGNTQVSLEKQMENIQ
ncbi:MAG: cholesterol oxidase [Flavobacteriaceae bacterium]|nr:MAG: cholesterol oxidase [Flavobacteriaceae bacterium]